MLIGKAAPHVENHGSNEKVENHGSNEIVENHGSNELPILEKNTQSFSQNRKYMNILTNSKFFHSHIQYFLRMHKM